MDVEWAEGVEEGERDMQNENRDTETEMEAATRTAVETSTKPRVMTSNHTNNVMF